MFCHRLGNGLFRRLCDRLDNGFFCRLCDRLRNGFFHRFGRGFGDGLNNGRSDRFRNQLGHRFCHRHRSFALVCAADGAKTEIFPDLITAGVTSHTHSPQILFDIWRIPLQLSIKIYHSEEIFVNKQRTFNPTVRRDICLRRPAAAVQPPHGAYPGRRSRRTTYPPTTALSGGRRLHEAEH